MNCGPQLLKLGNQPFTTYLTNFYFIWSFEYWRMVRKKACFRFVYLVNFSHATFNARNYYILKALVLDSPYLSPLLFKKWNYIVRSSGSYWPSYKKDRRHFSRNWEFFPYNIQMYLKYFFVFPIYLRV